MSNRVPPEKRDCPYVVVRVDPQWFDPNDPAGAITIVSLFDEESWALDDVERLRSLNGHKGCVYVVQRAKKYFRRLKNAAQ